MRSQTEWGNPTILLWRQPSAPDTYPLRVTIYCDRTFYSRESLLDPAGGNLYIFVFASVIRVAGGRPRLPANVGVRGRTPTTISASVTPVKTGVQRKALLWIPA